MAKKRVHEIAKAHGLPAKELVERLRAAGIDVKAAASSVEESAALAVLTPNGSASNGAPAPSAGSVPAPAAVARAASINAG